ncbi:hypothetical protein RTBOTA2_001023 [Rhodotorula toruloides]|nr:hypothetical protein RTBOTA2_001023 [Rhodotorula toruloides]
MSSSTGKRSSPSLATPPSAKRTRTALTLSDATNLTRDDALDLSHAELDALKKKGNGGVEWTEEKVKAKVEQVATVTHSSIKSLMKWQPSCKTGGKKFAYQGVVPHPDVFYTLFSLEMPKAKSKHWKQKKVPLEDFEKAVGHIVAPMRYGSLSINSPTVTIVWDVETLQFEVKGTYAVGY